MIDFSSLLAALALRLRRGQCAASLCAPVMGPELSGVEFTPVPLLHPVVAAHRAVCFLNPLCLTFAATSAPRGHGDELQSSRVQWSHVVCEARAGRGRALWAVGGQRKPEPRNSQSTASFHEKFRAVWRVGAAMPTSQKSGEEWRNYQLFSL